MELTVSFLIFLAAMLTCLFLGYSLSWALLLALIVIFLLGLKRGYSAKALFDMAWSKIPRTMIVLRILVFVGILTGLWRSSGTISFFIYYGIRSITPQYFVLVAFLLSSLVSLSLGTAFGVASAVGVVLMALARSGGVDPVITAGAVMSGIYLGDRNAPTSSCATLVAALTETQLYDNIKRMFKTAAIPFALCLVLYTVLSFRNPITHVDETFLQALREHSVINFWGVIPAALMLVLPLFRVPIRTAMGISAGTAFALTVVLQGFSLSSAFKFALLGYHSSDPVLGSVLSGGGLISMATPALILPLASFYTGILEGIGALEQMQNLLSRLVERIGKLPSMNVLSILSAMVLCNQTVVVMFSHQFINGIYARDEAQHEELAMDIANSAVTLSVLVPWCIACSVPLSALDVGIEALPYAFYLYLVPICYLLTKRFFFPPKK